MADRYEEVVYQGLFANLRDSLGGAVVGLLLFIAAFPILWWNEGRIDISKVAARSLPVGPEQVDPKGEGKLVSVTAALAVKETVGDPDFLKPGAHVRLDRLAEMWAWTEKSETRTEKKWGGGSEKRTVYTYVEAWTSTPRPSRDFKHPEGHENPPLPVASATFFAKQAQVGAYQFVPGDIELPRAERLTLDSSIVAPRNPRDRQQGNYLFRGRGNLSDPTLGDVRISFSAVKTGALVTAFGEPHGSDLAPYLYQDSDTLFRVLPGTREQAITALHTEHTAITWLLRLLGFAFLWIGMGLFFAPLNALLDIVPIAGTIGRTLVFVAMLPAALALALLVIILSSIAHNPILLALAFLGSLIAAWLLIQKRRAARQRRR